MIKIGKLKIGLKNKPIIIAEMSANHNQSLSRALKIVKAAAASGAHMLKLQTYTADTMTLNLNKGDFIIKDKNLWTGHSLYNLYRKAYTPWEWHKPIMKKAKELGMVCFSSAFDETSVEFLEKLNVPAYKIASFEITDLPLIQKVAETGKPIIISTGLATLNEIREAVSIIKKTGCKKYILLKCTSMYPAPPESSNILTIPKLRKLFKCEVGLSDHTIGIGSSLSAIAHGATIIEKHFTLSKKDKGVDSAFSSDPTEFSMLIKESINTWKSLGKVNYGPSKDEKASLKFRRSLYVAKDMKNGEKFTKKTLRIVRPGKGLAPKYYNKIIGRKINRKLKKGTAVKWGYLL